MKQPIAMKCTQEQFEAIEPKLENLEISGIFPFEEFSYLVNNRFGLKNHITNNVESDKNNYNRTVYEEWNEKIFLEACGIETEKTFRITESQIKKLKEHEGSKYVEEWFPEAFESEVKYEEQYVSVFINGVEYVKK